MKENNLLDKLQSAYKSGHSTETALLHVHNDIMMAVDKGKHVFLVLLDLSAAFDTVDHEILLLFLKEHVGLSGSVLRMFESYLQGRSQCISINNILSTLSHLVFGVPQGSVFGAYHLLYIHSSTRCYIAVSQNAVPYLCRRYPIVLYI